jgi:nitrous oxidase accessory protein NosD
LCRNSFRDNLSVVEVQGGGDASAAEWLLNEYSDYAGYDLDSNTVGDVAYEQTRLSSQLTGQYPQLAFFRGTPALLSLDTVQSALPLFPPKVMFRDAFPAMDVARLRTESAANSMGLSASRELDP